MYARSLNYKQQEAMSTKVKGLLKGLRYISQIFEEENVPEMQIGLPTDVKHIAHIGWDGPSVQESPSWMKEYKSQTGPLNSLGDPGDDSEIKWVSEDSRRGGKAAHGDLPAELPKPSRNPNDSPRKKDSSKSRHSRRHQSSDQETSQPPARNLPDIPKKSRRKKSKESVSGGSGSTRSRSKRSSSNVNTTSSNGESYTSPFSDPGPITDSTMRYPSSKLTPIPTIQEEQDIDGPNNNNNMIRVHSNATT